MRNARTDFYKCMEFVAWLNDAGEPVDFVDDRFNSHYLMRDVETNETWVSESTIAEEGVGFFSLADIERLGFTTAEYQAMLRFIFESTEYECVTSEEELDKLMSPGLSALGWR